MFRIRQIPRTARFDHIGLGTLVDDTEIMTSLQIIHVLHPLFFSN